MTTRTLRMTALAGSCLWPLAGWAESGGFDLDEAPARPAAAQPVPTSEIGAGLGYQAGKSAFFGRYSGLTREGAVSAGWFRLDSRSTGEGEGTAYLQAQGDNFDIKGGTALPDASASLRFGQQGLWDAQLTYDGIPYRSTDSFHSLMDSSGQLLNGLAPRALNVTAATPAGAALANASLSTRELGTRRDRGTAGLSYSGLENWKFSSLVEHEHKLGSQAGSLLFLSNNNFLNIPLPVNEDTDRFTGTADYTTKRLQARFSYVYSAFSDNNAVFTALSPFNAAVRAGYAGTQYSLDPSNREYRVKGQLGYSLTETTHLAANLSYGLQIQDDGLQARYYEQAPRLPDDSYNGLIKTLYGNVALTSRPWPNWNFRAAYTIDDRDNASTSYHQKAPYRGDGTAAFNGNGGIQINAPYSFLNQKVELDGGWRLLPSTRLTAAYRYTDRQRDYSVTDRNRENAVSGGIKSSFGGGVGGALTLSRGIRSATQYMGSNGWQSLGRAVTAENDLRMDDYAARKRNEVKASLDWAAGETFSLGVTGRYIDDEYPDSYYGVTDNRALSVGPDITYSPAKGLTSHLYYTFQENASKMLVNSASSASAVVWRSATTDSVHSLGLRQDWQADARLKLSAENTLSYGNTAFEEASWWRGGGLNNGTNTAVSLPGNRAITNRLSLSADYQLSDGLFVGLSGVWERFIDSDYLNNQPAASAASQTGTATLGATGNPGYSVGLLMATVRLAW